MPQSTQSNQRNTTYQRRNRAPIPPAVRRKKRHQRRRVVKGLFFLAIVFALVWGIGKWKKISGSSYATFFIKDINPDGAGKVVGSEEIQPQTPGYIEGIPEEIYNQHPEWTTDFLTVNEYSRPGDPLTEVKSIFVHYTANPGTSARQNRSYFEQQKDMHEASVSAHFIIGYNGEILQLVPLNEIAYAVKSRNEDSISIECCYKAKNGQFTQETYDSLLRLLRWLLDTYDLSTDDILRHYDCGGKKCPLYYVDHEDAWKQLKRHVAALSG